jgi:high-affinity nickel permease
MFGLDEQLAQLGDGAVFGAVILVAVLLGLRHATDPDHLAAVTALVTRDRGGARRARRMGFTWGLGHATSLFVLGVPIIVARAYLPDTAQTVAETGVGLIIIALAVRLLVSRRRSGGVPARSSLQAYGIGLVHGIGGTAGVGVLLLAGIPDHVEAIAALAVFALFTAVSMAIVSTTLGYMLTRRPVLAGHGAVGAGALSLAFGVWYSLGALHAVPYVF